MEIGISIVVTLVLILCNAYFSMAEMALVNAKHVVLRKEAEEGDVRARRALDLSADSDKMLATIQVGITLVSFFASAAAATTLTAPVSAWLQDFGIGWLSAISSPLATIAITLVVSYVSIVIGEILPKRIALADAENVSKKVTPVIGVFRKAASPLVRLTAASSNGLARLLGIKEANDRYRVSEDEIKSLVTVNDELIDDEKRMIHEIIELGDETAREVMVPRADMIMSEDTDTVKQTIDRMRGTGFSRLPVFREDHDRIVGIVHFKDLIVPLMDGKEDEPVGEYAREAHFVPETKDIFPLLSEMQTKRQQMAIVVDEYGGTDGLITVEDIIEEIVGDVFDESDLVDRRVKKLADDEWIAEGSLPCEDAVELGWPIELSGNYETVAGWLMDELDAVPRVGDEFDIGGFLFRIQAMRRNRISAVHVKKSVASAPDGDRPDPAAFGEDA